jgi:hypothetical protein
MKLSMAIATRAPVGGRKCRRHILESVGGGGLERLFRASFFADKRLRGVDGLASPILGDDVNVGFEVGLFDIIIGYPGGDH